MIEETLILKDFNWNVRILYSNNCTDYRNIIYTLEDLECPKALIRDANRYLSNCKEDCGLTYSNATSRKTIIIIFKCSSIDQLYNTCVHELYNFIRQLSTVEYSSEEDQAILIGNLFMEILPFIRDLICQI